MTIVAFFVGIVVGMIITLVLLAIMTVGADADEMG